MSTTVTYESGNTITIECDFKDANGNLVDPTNVTFITYDYKHTLLQTYTTGITHISTGKYSYDYATSSSPSRTLIYYEFNGMISGKLSLKRGQIETDFKVD